VYPEGSEPPHHVSFKDVPLIPSTAGSLLTIFGKKNEAQSSSVSKRDPRKAKRFFDHARTVADSRNYDYAIDCYIDGLRNDPDNMTVHEALREVALKRKAAGGKPAKLTDKFKKGGKDPIDRLLHTEMLSSKDPLNISLLADVMTRAVEAGEAEPDLNLPELAYWVGVIVLEANQISKHPNKSLYIQTRDLFARLRAFAKAVEAGTLALHLDPENTSLLQDLKNLEAERIMQESGFDEAGSEKGDFRSFIKDAKKQKQLEYEDAITKTKSGIEEALERCRTEYEQDPQDLDRLRKLVSALTQKESDEAEEEAVTLLKKALDQTGQYRFKIAIGDIRIKQFNRRLRMLQAHLKKNPDDTETPTKIKALLRRKLRFEFDEYTERIKNRPTDLSLRFELGRRLFALEKYDEAIGAFQQAKGDPKHRVVSMDFLGRCYMAQGWFEEAVDTLSQGVEAYPITDDPLAMELRYRLMLSLKQLAIQNKSADQAKEAQKIASQILQTDINFRDIRRQIDVIRKLVDEMSHNP